MTPIHAPNNYWERLEGLEKLIHASDLKAGISFCFKSQVLSLFFEKFGQIEAILKLSVVSVLPIFYVFFVFSFLFLALIVGINVMNGVAI